MQSCSCLGYYLTTRAECTFRWNWCWLCRKKISCHKR